MNCAAPDPPLEPNDPTAPVARREPRDVSVHGDPRIDDYHWLRDKHLPEVQAHLHAEDAHAQAWLGRHRATTQVLYDEMLGRIQEDDEELPYRKNGHWYSSRTRRGAQYPVLVRREDSPDAPEQVMLDVNRLARGKPFLELGDTAVSPDGRWLAYSVDETGALDYTLRVRDLTTGRDLRWRIEQTADIEWGNDSLTLYYLSQDAARRTHRLWRHRLGANRPDELLHEEPHALYSLGLSKTADECCVVLSTASLDCSDVHVIDADQPAATPRRVLPRQPGIEIALEHRLGRFYLLVNDRGRNFRLVETSAEMPSLDDAVELIAHRPDVMLEGLDLFAGHMVISEREHGVQKLRVWDFASGESHHIALPEPLCSASSDVNAEFDTTVFRLGYSSLVCPETICDYDMVRRTLTQRKRQPVLGGYDPGRYRAEQLMARAPDGTLVPVSLVYRRDLRQAGAQPLLLYGYGAYGEPIDVHFSSSRVSLLDRGVIFAIAHVRGGGDLGQVWYDHGKRALKMNSFTDFVACAEALIDAGYTDHSRLIAEGASAGGLLVCAAVNLRPELFHAVAAEVPFVDIINTMLDETLPLTVGEYLEWGNPKVAADYAAMRRYCPYDNLQSGAHPAMFLRTSLNDSQVPCWEAAKYIARLRTLQTADRPLLLAIDMDSGHGGASGRYDALMERAQLCTFMLVQWGLEGAAPAAS